VICVPTDVCDEAQVQALMQAAVSEFGRIDVCVVNASVYGYGTFEATPSDVFRRIVETNLLGAVNTARQALPTMREQGAGTLIFIGSVYSRITSPYVSAYVASKFGLYGFVRVLRQELRTVRGVHISMVLPATIDTPIYQHAANYTGQHVHPLPPVVHPDRVAQAILRNAENPRAVTIVGAVQRTFIPLHALLPRLYDACVGPLMNLVALRRGRATPHPGTVFAAVRGGNPITGGWGRLGRLHRSAPPTLRDRESK
jgi:short-subunit dehydrogenase